jgi:hypothetical protein
VLIYELLNRRKETNLGPSFETEWEIEFMRLGAIQTVHKKLWQWLKNQIVQDVPASDQLCEYDCRKQQCSEEEWENCERRIQQGAGELWPSLKPTPIPPQIPEAIDYRSPNVSHAETEQTLARLKCAHCQSLFNCDALAQEVLAELRRSGIEYRRVEANGPTVTDPEFIEAVRRGIDRFLHDSFGSENYNESCPPAA